MTETIPLCGYDIRLSPAQAWWLDGSGDLPPYWALLACIECHDRLDFTVLAEAIRAVSKQHQAFRFKLKLGAGGWNGFLDVAPDIAVEECSMAELTSAEQDRRLAAMEPQLGQSLEAIGGPVARFIYVDRGTVRPPLLWIAFNHLVCDHYSVLVLLGDIEHAYRQIERGGRARFESPSSSLEAWIDRLHHMANSAEIEGDREYWLASCAAVPASALPVLPSTSRGVDVQAAAQSLAVTLGPTATERLYQQAANAASPERGALSCILAALGLAYRRWVGRDKLLVYMVNHGRSPSLHGLDLHRTVGCMFHSFPFLLQTSMRSSSLTPGLAAEVGRALDAVPRHGIAYDLLRYLRPGSLPAGELASLPEPEIVLSFRGTVPAGLSEMFTGLNWELSGARSGPTKQRRQVIQIDAVVSQGSLMTTFTHSGSLSHEVVQQFADAYAESLTLA
jgi:non-ribosomal peptide synthase protein (TIGR01720 family)